MKVPRSVISAFTLVELLVVVAIMGALLAVVVPMAGSMKKSGELNKAITQISLSLEQARAYAMGNNTYVWVGFREDQNAKTLTMSLIAGNSGAASDLADKLWKPISNPFLFDQIQFDNGTGVPGIATAEDVRTSSLSDYELPIQGRPTIFEQTIRFGPTGDAQIKEGEISRWIQLGLKQANQAEKHPNVAVLQVAGLSGQVRIFRP